MRLPSQLHFLTSTQGETVTGPGLQTLSVGLPWKEDDSVPTLLCPLPSPFFLPQIQWLCRGGGGARGGGKEDGQQKPSCSLEDRSIQGRRSCKREACLRWQHRAGLPSLNAQTQYSSLHENDPANLWKLILVWRKTGPVSLAAICTFSPMTILCVPSDVVSMPSPGHAVSMASSTTNTLMSLAPSS